jgi:transcriptional regulator with XRE-family HTH domain
MTEWERDICARVKTFRERIKWSQSEFAAQLGISLNQLASIEYGRTPLRYDIAWRMRREFGVSLSWLDEGFTFPDMQDPDPFPSPASEGLPARALLSTVARMASERAQEEGLSALNALGQNADIPAVAAEIDKFVERVFGSFSDMQRRWVNMTHLNFLRDQWLAAVPPGHVDAFTEAVMQAAKSFLDSLPAEPDSEIERRSDELMWIRIRDAVAKKFAREATKGLTDTSSPEMIAEMRTLKGLLAKAAHLTEQVGKKTELAKFLNVAPETVSRYLSRSGMEPGGETTLKLLNWVEAQERLTQQKTPGNVSSTSKGESTRRKGKVSETKPVPKGQRKT